MIQNNDEEEGTSLAINVRVPVALWKKAEELLAKGAYMNTSDLVRVAIRKEIEAQ